MENVSVLKTEKLTILLRQAQKEIAEMQNLLKIEQEKLEIAAKTFWHMKNTSQMAKAAEEFAKIEQQMYDAQAKHLLLQGIDHSSAVRVAEVTLNTKISQKGLRVLTNNPTGDLKRTAWAFKKLGEENAWLLVGYQKNKKGMVVYEPEFIRDTHLGKTNNE